MVAVKLSAGSGNAQTKFFTSSGVAPILASNSVSVNHWSALVQLRGKCVRSTGRRGRGGCGGAPPSACVLSAEGISGGSAWLFDAKEEKKNFLELDSEIGPVGALQIVAAPNSKRLVLKLQCIDFGDLGVDSRGFGSVESDFRTLGDPICRKWALLGGNNLKGRDSMVRLYLRWAQD